MGHGRMRMYNELPEPPMSRARPNNPPKVRTIDWRL